MLRLKFGKFIFQYFKCFFRIVRIRDGFFHRANIRSRAVDYFFCQRFVFVIDAETLKNFFAVFGKRFCKNIFYAALDKEQRRRLADNKVGDRLAFKVRAACDEVHHWRDAFFFAEQTFAVFAEANRVSRQIVFRNLQISHLHFCPK